jgi:hypothetical protein
VSLRRILVFVLSAALAVTTVGLAACGTAATPATTAVASVALLQTGGFAAIERQVRVDAETAPPSGIGANRKQKLFELAASDEFRRLRASYLPASTCCDRFAYKVTVAYRDGTTKSVATMDGIDRPPVLDSMLAILLARRLPASAAVRTPGCERPERLTMRVALDESRDRLHTGPVIRTEQHYFYFYGSGSPAAVDSV